MKKYMVVERFKDGLMEENYKKFNEKGRMLPDGLYFLNSWVNAEESICFQLMESNDAKLFDTWIAHWKEFTDFTVYPID
jgi:hypothetical protein